MLGMAIDKYCYLTVRYLPPYFEHLTRIVYSIEEWVNYNREIRHPAVRECLKYLNIKQGVEICHMSDLLAKKGLGTSSTFTVGLLNALGTLTWQGFTKKDLADTAILIEQDRIGESVGCQDQYLSALGGINHIKFNADGTIDTKEVAGEGMIDYLMLFDTATSRVSSMIASSQIEATPDKKYELTTIGAYVEIALALLREGRVEDVGRVLHESWMVKKSLTSKISTVQIDAVYDKACQAGATGGKLLGAGGGGYMLFFADPEKHKDIEKALYGLRRVPFKLDTCGTEIIHDDEDENRPMGFIFRK